MKRRLVRIAFILAPLLLLGIIALRGLGSFLVYEDPLEKADGIMILGGTMYDRQLEAVDLYKDGWAPRLFLLREVSEWGEVELMNRGIKYLSVVDAQVDVMERLGVPRDRITILDPANSTTQEADILRNLALREKFTKVIIVTSKQHTRRAPGDEPKDAGDRSEGDRASQPIRSRQRRSMVDRAFDAAFHAVRNATAVRVLGRRRGLIRRRAPAPLRQDKL